MTKDHAHREEESADLLEQKCNREVHDVLADERSHGQNSGESEAAEERRIGQEMKAVVESDELRVRGQRASVDEGAVKARRKRDDGQQALCALIEFCVGNPAEARSRPCRCESHGKRASLGRVFV